MSDTQMPHHRPQVDYRILGPVQVWAAGERVAIGGTRALALVALLASDPGRIVGLDRLVDALWDQDPPDNARQLIHTTVSRLRRVLRDAGLGDALVTDGPGYRLAGDPDDVDAARFERLVGAASAAGDPGRSAALLREALDQWRGPALSGADSEVLRAVGAALDERRLIAVEALAVARLELGEQAAVVADLRPWVAAEPLRERLRELLILALYRSGRRAEALEEYQQVRRLLGEGLGMDPGPALAELHSRILADDPALLAAETATAPDAPPAVGGRREHRNDDDNDDNDAGADDPASPERRTVRSLLPVDTADFTGRDAELALMLAGIEGRAGPQVMLIDGMAGIGKTTLAVRAARELSSEYPDGQVFVDLLGHTPGRKPMSAENAVQVLLQAVDVPSDQIPADQDAAGALWRETLAAQRVLIVLDNAVDSAQVRPLLPGTDASLVIVTSRRRLVGVDAASAMSLDLLDQDSADALFVAVAGERTADPTEVSRVTQLCGHLPLAIRLVAAKLRHRPQWSVADLLARLDDENHRLDRLAAEDRSVAAAIAVSYEQLNPELRRGFRLLGAHPGRDFDLHAAAALLDRPVAGTEELLDELYDHNLVHQGDRARYGLHDLLRQFARDLLDDEPDSRSAAEGRLFDHYLAGALAAGQQLSSVEADASLAPAAPTVPAPVHDQASALAWYRSEEENLLVSSRLAALRNDRRRVLAMPIATAGYVLYWGRRHAWLAPAEAGIRAAEELGDSRMTCRAVQTLGTLLLYLGRSEEAAAHFDRIWQTAERHGHLAEQAVAIGATAYLDLNAGRWELGADRYRQAIELHRAAGRQRSLAVDLVNLANANSHLGRLDEALGLLAEAGKLAADLQLTDVSLAVMINSGGDLQRLRRYDEAEDRLIAALALAREQGNPRALVASLSTLASIYRKTDRDRQAADRLAEALEVSREFDDAESQAKVLVGLAEVEHALGRPTVTDHANEALEIASQHELFQYRVRAQACLAGAHATAGRSGPAREQASRALAAIEQADAAGAPMLEQAIQIIREVLDSVPHGDPG